MIVSGTTTIDDLANIIGRDAVVQSVSVSTDYERRMVSRVEATFLARYDYTQSTAEHTYGWVSCNIKTPSTDDDVLVCLDGVVSIGSYWGDGQWSVTPAPTHWRSMPAPPTRSRS